MSATSYGARALKPDLMPDEDDSMLRDIGARVAALRGRRSQRDLAAKCGIDVSTISRLENGRYNPSTTTLVRLASELGTSVDALLGLAPVSPSLAAVNGHPQSLEARVAELERQMVTALASAEDAIVLARRLQLVDERDGTP